MVFFKIFSKFFLILTAIFTLASFFLIVPAHAQLIERGPGLLDTDLGIQYGQETGLNNMDPRITVARIIRVGIGILGILDVVIIVYAGFLWMTAGGNEEKVGEAKKWLYGSVIGLAIIFSAYALAGFIIDQLTAAIGGWQ